jgi:hypothetical protein
MSAGKPTRGRSVDVRARAVHLLDGIEHNHAK